MRLIDADKLIEDITNTINEWIKEMPDGEYLKGNVNFAEMAKEIVRNQPIVFNVDKVVEQLEEKSKMNLKKGLIEVLPDEARPYLKAVESFDKAIEIVRRGGIDE